MRIRVFFLLSSLILSSCTHKSMPVPESAKTMHTRSTLQVADFTQLHVQGVMNVNLHTGYKHPSVHLRGDPRDLKNIVLESKGYALWINMKKAPLYGPVTADIRTRELTTFRYKGAGLIRGDKLHTRQLNLFLDNHGNARFAGSIGLNTLFVKGSGFTSIDGVTGHNLNIRLKGKPKVRISGIVNVSRISTAGSGWLGLQWVKSPNLLIRSHGAVQMQLAGITDKLDVELWDKAQFKGRYLRARTTFVKTHGHSRAEIATLKRQHTLALDASDIYYVNPPQFEANFMGNNGAVLDFGRPA